MSDIFLSYKTEDRQRAKIIAKAIEQYRYSVWWDRIIPPGRSFDKVIEEELDAAKCVVVLWSKDSVMSDWVKEEADEGLRRKILIPVLIDDVKIPLGFRRKQAANLINWNGTSDHEEFDLLLSSIEEIVGQPLAQKKDIKKLAKGIIGVSTQVTVPRNYEIRGTVMDQSSGTTTHPSWDAGSFAGFFYDIKNNISTETLTINDDFANLQ